MTTEEERCAEARKFRRIADAFNRGDLDALRAAVDDPALVPNGRMPDSIGSCLVYAIYHSPLAFIQTLLKMGANPNAPVDDGFPPLIAALTCTREVPGAPKRTDVDAELRTRIDDCQTPARHGARLGAARNCRHSGSQGAAASAAAAIGADAARGASRQR